MRSRLLMLLIPLLTIALYSAPAEARDRARHREVRSSWIPTIVIQPYGVHEPYRFHETHRPPGWDRGRKTGWGACDLPPGQAKKHGCGWGYGYDSRRQRRAPAIVIQWP